MLPENGMGYKYISKGLPIQHLPSTNALEIRPIWLNPTKNRAIM